MSGARISYMPEELAWIEARKEWPRKQLHSAFCFYFDRTDVSCDHIKSLCCRKGWSAGPEGRRRNAGKSLVFTSREVEWLHQNAHLPRHDAVTAFQQEFGREVSLTMIVGWRKRNGVKTGRTGRFIKGQEPPNKGKPMAPDIRARCAPTMFKKGNRLGQANLNYKPIGTERVNEDGYLERKVHDGLPRQSRWRLVHLLNWEALHGPVPEGMCLKSRDGNRQNTDPSNWSLIERALLPALNGGPWKGLAYDEAAPEVKPALMALARLRRAKGEAKRRARA